MPRGACDDTAGLDLGINDLLVSTDPGLDNSHLFNKLGLDYLTRFEEEEDLSDVEDAIRCFELAVQNGHPSLYGNLALAYKTRFEWKGSLLDLDHTVKCIEIAVDSTPEDQDDFSGLLSNLGIALLTRFERQGNLADLDQAIEYGQKAVKSSSYDDPGLPGRFTNLGLAFRARFERTGKLIDANSAIEHCQEALGRTLQGSADFPKRSSNLGLVYRARFEQTGDLTDLEISIKCAEDALQATSNSHFSRPTLLSGLAIAYKTRFHRIGDPLDIENAIQYGLEALKLTPAGHINLPGRLSILGLSYLARSGQVDDLVDIENAVSYIQKAVESSPTGHSDIPGLLSDLGNAYLTRFKRVGDSIDLDYAIKYGRESLAASTGDHADFPLESNCLAIAYITRFHQTGDSDDLENAVKYSLDAVEATPENHADRPRWSNTLGDTYITRFEHGGDLVDLENGIQYAREAVERSPEHHAKLPLWSNNLGTAYRIRFGQLGDQADLDKAIRYGQDAVNSTPVGDASLPRRLNNLAFAHECRFSGNNSPRDLAEAISAYWKSAQASGPPSIRLDSAKSAAALSARHGRPECLEYYALAVGLLTQIAAIDQNIERRHANIAKESDLASVAAGVAFQFGRADLALEWLEEGRSLVWTQLNQLRTPIEDVERIEPGLARRFLEITTELERLGYRESHSIRHDQHRDLVIINDISKRHAILAKEYETIVADIRKLPELRTFLRPMSSSDILDSVPPNGTVVLISVNDDRCDAVALVRAIGKPIHIPLRLTLESLGQIGDVSLKSFLSREDGLDKDRYGRTVPRARKLKNTLRNLWNDVVFPIISAMEIKVPPEPSERGRLWWCATGPLAFLPLHAAGIYGADGCKGSCVSDYVVSSYTPTVRSLSEKFKASVAAVRQLTTIALVSQAKDLPGTENETRAVEYTLQETQVAIEVIKDKEASVQAVKAKMTSNNWVHFACHGAQDLKEPLKSKLLLSDGGLNLRQIMQLHLDNPELAFLAACQTSRGDTKLSDESVHLAAGMLAAGYRSVVGTMWRISDTYGEEFAKAFYEYLLERKISLGCLDSTQAGYALDHAVGVVRRMLGDDERDLSVWVPYVHFGY